MSTIGIGFDHDLEDAPSPFDPFACDNTLAGKDPEPYGHINPIENGTALRIV